jgi:hypothetical protein
MKNFLFSVHLLHRIVPLLMLYQLASMFLTANAKLQHTILFEESMFSFLVVFVVYQTVMAVA